MQVVHTGQTQPFRDHAEADAVVFLAGIGAVTCAVHVQDHVVVAAPFADRLDRGPTDDQVDHDDDTAQLFCELGAGVHLFHGGGSDVQVMALDLAGFGAGLVDGLHAVEEAITPVHKGLRVDVLVVLHKVQTALQALIDHTAIVLARQTQFRLGRCAQEGLAELVQTFAFHDHAGGRACKGFHIGHGEAHVFQTGGFERLETKDVADDRRGQVGDRTLFEQDQVIGHIAKVLTGVVRDRLNLIGLCAVTVAGGQTVGPDHGPRRGRAFTSHSGGGLDRVHALLGGDAEQGQDIGVLGLIIPVPVPHLGVFQNAGFVAFFSFDFLGIAQVVHAGSPPIGRLALRVLRQRLWYRFAGPVRRWHSGRPCRPWR